MIGADIVDVRRMERAVKNQAFVTRVFTEDERAYASAKRDPSQSYAGLFAAKEAVAKLSGKGIRGFRLSDIEIVHTDLGAPKVRLHGKAATLFRDEIYVSVSHEADFAFAVASYSPCDFAPKLPGKELHDGDIELPPRGRFTHKGDYGRVYVVGGSSNMVGAPLMTAESALRAGAGLTTLCAFQSLLPSYRERVKEIMLFGLKDGEQMDEEGFAAISERADVIVMGMGMVQSPIMRDIISYLFREFAGTLILDATAINELAAYPELIFLPHKGELILTPHVGEYNRLSEAAGVPDADDLALAMNAVIARKDAYTLVTDGITSYKVTSGTAAMAKGGSGDVLAGIIAAYACRLTPLQATALACHTFGRTGEKAAKIKGENAVIASDIINLL